LKLQLFSIAQASNPNHSSSPPHRVTRRKGEHSGLHLHATTSHDLTAHVFPQILPMSAMWQLLCLNPLKQIMMRSLAGIPPELLEFEEL
jgi:hypothetical protein